MHVCFLFPVLLAIELTLCCQMCYLHFKFHKDRTKTAVPIEDDRYFAQTDRHTYTQVILYLSNAIDAYTVMKMPNLKHKEGGG